MAAQYFFIFIIFTFGSQTSNVSPYMKWNICNFESAVCSCASDGTSVKANCSYRGLNKAPIFTSNVTWIKLTGNNITKMPASFPEKVRYIDISRNCIANLKENHFKGLSQLEYLNLERNMIEFKKSNFFPGLFTPLRSLTVLNIKHNSKYSSESGFYDFALSRLRHLEVLKIDATWNASFGDQFRLLKKLRHLDLSGITGFCNLSIVGMDLFFNLPYLTSLDISECKIMEVEKNAFGFLKGMQKLDISHNRELGFASLPNITHNLNQTKIQHFYFDDNNCITGLGKILKVSHIINLRNTSITEISLARNRIELMEDEIFRYFPTSLSKLSIAENKLTTGRYLFSVEFLSNLLVLNMSLNLKPPPYAQAIFDSCTEKEGEVLEQISLSLTDKLQFPLEASLTATKIPLFFRKTSKSAGVSSRKMAEPEVKADRTLTFYFPFLPPNLEIVYLNSSRLFGEVAGVTFSNNKIREVYAQNNFIYSLKGPIIGPADNLAVVDFSNNFCNHISPHFLKVATNLKSLNLARNSFGSVLMGDRSGEIFEKQENLEYLDLSHNNIYFLPSKIFKNLNSLKKLILRDNHISKLHFHVGYMKGLGMLDLSDNKIGSIIKDKMDVIRHLFTYSNTSIDLDRNPLLCTCKNIQFLQWIKDNRQYFRNLHNYTCSELSQTTFDFKYIDSSVDSLLRSCKSYLVWYIIASTFFTCMVCILIGIIIKKNIWTIRYFLHKSKQKFDLRRYTGINEQCPRADYEYDACVSYVGRDRAFVMDKMIKELHDNAGLKLFIRDLDFELGVANVDNIMNGLRNSRRTICVVTKAYLQSKWRDYELNMAKVEGIKDRGSLSYVHLILMPEVNQSGDIKKIIDLVKRNYYTEYPENSGLQGEFWRKLTSVISTDPGQ